MKDLTMDIEFHIQTDDDVSCWEIRDALKRIINTTVPTGNKDFVITRKEYEIPQPIEHKYLDIDLAEVKYLVECYEEWYGTFDKDGYKYVIETLDIDDEIKDKYHDDLLSSLHNYVKGGEFYLIKKRENK
jgi:hypothetical protein